MTFALVSLYSRPDEGLLKLSHGTVMSCRYQGTAALRVIPISDIHAVVGMLPHPNTTPTDVFSPQGSFYVAEKLGLEASLLRGEKMCSYENTEE